MPEPKRPLKVFLSYASQDKSLVRELSRRLVGEGWIDTWQDEKNLLPGQDWRVKIEEAVEEADVVIIVLSQHSVSKEGHVQKELRYAREIALEKPDDAIFLVPLRLEECEVPRGLRFYQWVDYFGEGKNEGYDSLVKSLKLRYEQKLKQEDAEYLRKKQLEQGTAEKIAHEKAEKEAFEKARLKEDEEVRLRLAQAKAERETAEKVAREKAFHDSEKRDDNKKVERETAKKSALKVTTAFPEENRIKSLKPNISRQLNVIITLSIIGLVGVICIALLGRAIAGSFPLATATPVIDLSPAPTSTSRPDPTSALMRTPTSFSTRTPDYLSGSEILFATKDGSIYSFENSASSKIGSITVSDWHDPNASIYDYIWSWDASKDLFILGSFSYQDVYFIDRTGQLKSGLTVPYTNYCPNLSRDGGKIVTQSQAAANGNIWVFNTDGSNFIRLSSSSTMSFGCPSWSPDGKTIAVPATESREDYVVILDLEGGIVKQFKKSEYFSDISSIFFFWYPPVWSPDGKSLIICGEGGIYEIDIESSTGLKLFDTSVITCDWSPDGKYVVYATTSGLNLLDMNTKTIIDLLDVKDVVSVAWK